MQDATGSQCGCIRRWEGYLRRPQNCQPGRSNRMDELRFAGRLGESRGEGGQQECPRAERVNGLLQLRISKSSGYLGRDRRYHIALARSDKVKADELQLAQYR